MSRQSLCNRRDRQQFSIYADLPRLSCHVETGAFGHWIMAKGGHCLHTTSQYEVARWRSHDHYDVAVLYKKADGTLTWTISAANDYRAFLKGH